MPDLQNLSPVRITLTLGVAQTLAWGSTYYLPAILAAPIAAELNLSTGNVFLAFSFALLMSAVLGPSIGRRIDRRGGRDVLAISSLIFACGLLLMSLANGAVMLWSAWLLLGIGMSMGLYDAAFATLTSIYGLQARRSITGITLIAGFASTICWPITAWLNVNFGWRETCAIWAGVHLLVTLPLNRWGLPLSGSKRRKVTADATIPLSITEPQSLTEPKNLTVPNRKAPASAMPILAFVFAVTWFISTGIAAHLPQMLLDAGMSATAAIATAALIGPAQVGARLVEFTLLRHANPLHSARVATLAHPAGALAMVVFGPAMAVLFTLFHGAGNGLLTISKGTIPLLIFGPDGYGHRVGVLMVPARFAQALAPFIFALMLTNWGMNALLFTGTLGIAIFIALTVLHKQTQGMQG